MSVRKPGSSCTRFSLGWSRVIGSRWQASPGVREIRIRDGTGAFRVLYVMKIEDAIYVLHAFQKKTQKTAKHELDLAMDRLRGI